LLGGLGIVLAAGAATALGIDRANSPTAGLDPGVVTLETATARVGGEPTTVPAQYLDEVVPGSITLVASSSKYQVLVADGRTAGERCLSVWPQSPLLDEVGRTEVFNTTLGSLAGCWDVSARAKAHLYAFVGPKGLSGLVYVPVDGATVQVNGGEPEKVVGSTHEFWADACQPVEVVTTLADGSRESHSFTATPIPVRVGESPLPCS
jgi:hypothetical protein